MNKKLLFFILTFFYNIGFSQTNYIFDNNSDSGDGTWETATNWNPEGVPGTNDNITITDYVVSINSDISVNNLSVRSDDFNGRLQVNKVGSLIINGTLTLDDAKLDIQSDSNEFGSLIINGSTSFVNGSSTRYFRWVNAENGTPPINDGWDLIGSPIDQVAISSVVSDPDLATNGSNYAIGVFSNDGSTDTESAMYTMVNSGDLSGSFSEGIGYSMATDETVTPGTTLDFTGTVKTTDLTVSIDDETATLTNYGKWN